jgi:hypothetical protein
MLCADEVIGNQGTSGDGGTKRTKTMSALAPLLAD